MRLQDRVAVVTGAGRGIGRAICLQFARQGAHLACWDVDESLAAETAALVSKVGTAEGAAYGVDVTDLEAVMATTDAVLERFSRVDILVNNAGITRDNLLVRMTPEQWDQVMAVNLKGAFYCTRAIARTMMKQRSGRIVNVASVVGLMGNAGQANYCASKAGLIGFTKSVAREFASRGITVNAVAPGFIETKMTRQLGEKNKNAFLQAIPLNRYGRPEDVAQVISFLVSSDAGYVTGQVINVDGGMLMS
jgi:3-oxoacyl-[acyl-carrier protein] reductase